MKRALIISCIISFILLSCAHQAIVFTDPTIVVNSPNPPPSFYQNGDTVQINFDFSDEDELHEAFVYVRSDVDTLFSYIPYVHELPSFNVDTFWVVSGVTTGISASITGVATNHHDGVTTMNVPITLVP